LPDWAALRARLEFFAFRFVAAVFTALPLEFAAAFSGWGWRMIAPRLPRHRRALDNLARAFPEKSVEEREQIATKMWDHLGRTFAEFFHMPQILAEQRVALEPIELFEGIAKGPPFVVCVPPLGHWEVSSQAGLRFGLPIAGTYQALTNPLVDAWIRDRRKPMYPGGIFEKSQLTARAMVKLAREGGYPAFVADLRESGGVATNFFGREAMSTPFPALLARSADMPLYAACVVRQPGSRFFMRIARVEAPHTADRQADVRIATQGIQSAFEAFIRDYPEQWMWAHRRWG
jgi:KDO2-lipid IV(A) lauroyltransferase